MQRTRDNPEFRPAPSARYACVATLAALLLANAADAGEIKQVRSFETWAGGVIRSTDPAGITYHPPSGHLFISDSEISEMRTVWDCENIFEVSLFGDQVFNSYDARTPTAVPCPPCIDDELREPTGIAYSTFDGHFYVVDDDRHLILRYDENFGAPLAVATFAAGDFEDIAVDPSDGYLYVVTGGSERVKVFDPNMQPVREFSVRGIVSDPEGIAFNEAVAHLFLLSSVDLKLFEFTLDGEFVTDYDISHFYPRPMVPQGLTFAPSSDPADDPRNLSVYIVDAQLDNTPVAALDRDGIIYEAAILPYDVLADKKVMFDVHDTSHGTVHANDKVEFKWGAPSVHTGNVQASNMVQIDRGNTIHGDVLSGGKVKIQSGATVDGTVMASAAVATEPLLRIVSVATGPEAIRVKANETVALNPGAYNSVEVGTRAKLSLRSGWYSFASLKLADDAVLAVDAASGGVFINVTGSVHFHNRARVDVPAGSRCLTLQVSGEEAIFFRDLVQFSGTVVAPLAKVEIGPQAAFEGAIVARDVVLRRLAALRSHSSSRVAPRARAAASIAQAPFDGVTEVQGAHLLLEQNVPNPLNPETVIRFELRQAALVSLRVVDARGRVIRLLRNDAFAAGRHEVRWDGRDDRGQRVSSGVYFCQAQTGSESQIRRMTVLK